MTVEQPSFVETEGEEVVLFLEAQDELGTVRTKLEHVRGKRIALVVPPASAALQRSISVRLLKRMAESYAIDLCIVTADGDLQRLAREENVAVFSSVRGFRRHLERNGGSHRRVRRIAPATDRTSRAIISIGSVVAVTLLVLIAAFLLIPAATVILRPATEPIGETIEMRADPEARTVDFVGRRVPGRAIYDSVEGTDQVLVTGVGQGGQGRSEGRVTFTNRTRSEVEVVAGTVVSTTVGVKFVVIETVHLAPASGAWAQANVRAADPGPQGNVPRLAISQVGGQLGRDVSVLNEEPTVGGGQGDVGVVTDADLKRLHDQLYGRLAKEATAKLAAAIRTEETVPPEIVRLTVLEETFDRRVGDQTKALNLRMVVRVNATAFELNDVNNLAERAWQPRLRAGYAIVPDSVQLLPPVVTPGNGDVLNLRVRVDAVAAALISSEQVNSAVRWRAPRDAADELGRSFMLAEQPTVTVEPGWAKRAMRVNLIVKDKR